MTDPNELAVGTILRGRYRIERRLGRGSYGAAYRAIDLERFDEARAVKRLHPDHRQSERSQELFEREARVLASISHPLVPCLHHYFELDGDFYLVEDYVEGEPWDRVLARRGPIPEAEVRAMAMDVLEVLAVLHARVPAVIHRDIKPSNLIRRTADGRTVLIDFGAVREVIEHDDRGTVIGSLGYAPPEQAQGQPTTASDLFALGATMTHLLTRRPPSAWHDPETGAIDIAGKLPVEPAFATVIEQLFCDKESRIPTAHEARRRLLACEAPEVDGEAGTTDLRRANVAVASATVDLGARGRDAGAPRSGVARAAMPAPSIWTRPAVLVGTFLLLASGAYGAVVTLAHKPEASSPHPPEREAGAADPRARDPSPVAVRTSALGTSAVGTSAGGTSTGGTSTDAGGWERSDAVTASGLTVSIQHPAAWRARRPAGAMGIVVRHLTAQLRAPPGSLALELPDSGGVFVVGLDAFADPGLPIDRFLQDWTHAVGAGAVTAGMARPIAPDVYQATLTAGPTNAGPVGFIHAVVVRERTGSRVLWRAFLGNVPGHQQDVQLVMDSLHVVAAAR